jgi:hypothetical protein
MIATKIQLYDKLINDIEWGFYLRGALAASETTEKRPEFISEKVFDDLANLSKLTPSFKNLLK